MKVIIAGSRTITEMSVLQQAIAAAGFDITEVISGGAKGVDELGNEWARQNKLRYRIFWALWKTHGRAAGPIRNQEMADFADALIAVWDGRSRGTADMIRRAQAKGLPVYVHHTAPRPLPAVRGGGDGA